MLRFRSTIIFLILFGLPYAYMPFIFDVYTLIVCGRCFLSDVSWMLRDTATFDTCDMSALEDSKSSF